MLNDTHYKFTQQQGVHIVAHLEDYFSANPKLAGKVLQAGLRQSLEPWTEGLFRDLITELTVQSKASRH